MTVPCKLFNHKKQHDSFTLHASDDLIVMIACQMAQICSTSYIICLQRDIFANPSN